MSTQTLVLFILGIVLLVAGAEAMVRGASRLAAAVGISPLVIGLTVVAFGTSSPELAVALRAGLTGASDIAMGNVVGSNIFNVLFILGLSALIAPLIVAHQLIRLDVILMIVTAVATFLMALDGTIGRVDGAILFAGVIAYTVFVVRQSLAEGKEVREEYEREYGERPRDLGGLLLNVLLVIAGLALLMLGSRWLVDGAVAVARALSMSELIIGLTIVAAGTSLPEVATSVVASIRGEREIAVGNVVGSSLFNVMCILGLAGIVAPDGIRVAAAVLRFDLPVMIVVSAACLPIFFTGYRIDRWEGLLFLGYYAAYTLYLVLDAQQHDALPAFSAVMGSFVVPLTLVTLAVLGTRAWRRERRERRAAARRAMASGSRGDRRH